MRALLILLVSLGIVASVHAADPVTGRVFKVLPFYMDRAGQIAKSPSLFDRDAYQAYLRSNPTNIAAMRFDVLWNATRSPEAKFKIAVEVRAIGTNSLPQTITLETNVAPRRLRQWTALPLSPADYAKVGRSVTWRVTLWDGDQQLAEQKSFLW